jgi:hypothetical protein
MPCCIPIANGGETRGSRTRLSGNEKGEDLYERRRARAIELFIRMLAKERTKKTRYQVIAHEMVCFFGCGDHSRILQLAPHFSAGMLVVTRVDSVLRFFVQERNLLLRN